MRRSDRGLQCAIQMDRDGIRTIHRKRRPICGYKHNPDDLIVMCCHKRAGYSTPLGNRCFEHAIKSSSHPLFSDAAKAGSK